MREGKCKHFNGIQNVRCEAGVRYKDFPELPCLSTLPDGTPTDYEQVYCEKLQYPTKEEIAEYDQEMEVIKNRFLLVLPIIGKVKDEHKGKDWAGNEECPACGKVLHLRHAAINGHVWGQCETENCLSWME